ncbi:hypothetical protein BpHYR1_050610 [Brachionus plicatilis]|uniref:Uncharacterized protein n=1 Tax=Brachionus plicatilis TaxID=10195 RepID=A0A3M7QBU1_BRAPC|nr:hypothetical protein BpHYR1_050610 [Brachionus plicatilis]
MNAQLNYQLLNELKPKRKGSPVRTIRCNIQINLATYLAAKYGLSKRYYTNNRLFNDLDLSISNYLSKTNVIRVQKDSIKFILNKKRPISILDNNLNEKKFDGHFYIAIKFNIEEIVLD